MYTLHPVTTELVAQFQAGISDPMTEDLAITQARDGYARMQVGDSRGPDIVTTALTQFLAGRMPTFVLPDLSLSGWEASIERGVGMLMRPPSRLFVDAGVDRAVAQRFPIRLDNSGASMAGAFVPGTLVPQLHELLVSRLDRQVRRLRDAETDPVLAMASLLAAVAWAHTNGTGLLEAVDVLAPGLPIREIVQITSRKQVDPGLRAELEAMLKPPKKPGMISRMIGRGR